MSNSIHPKARSILKVLPHHSNPKFLQLPAELRNRIYKYALVESPVIDRRHESYCPFRTAHWTSQPPSWTIHEYSAISQPWTTDANLKCCRCTKRGGLNLLRTNRQIYHEASEMFWHSNTFTFTENVDTMLSFVENEPALHRVRQLSFRLLNGEKVVQRSYYRVREVWNALARLANLQYLDLPPEYFQDEDLWIDLFRCSSLIWCTMDMVTTPAVQNHAVRFLFMGIHMSLKVPFCGRDRTVQGPWCQRCHKAVVRFMSRAHLWPVLRKFDLLTWKASAEGALVKKARARRGADVPYVLNVQLKDGGSQEVSVWGLPIETPAVYQARRLKERAAARRARIKAEYPSRVQRTPLVQNPDQVIEEMERLDIVEKTAKVQQNENRDGSRGRVQLARRTKSGKQKVKAKSRQRDRDLRRDNQCLEM